MKGRVLLAAMWLTIAASGASLAAQQQTKAAASDADAPAEQREEKSDAQNDGPLKNVPRWLKAFSSPDDNEGVSVTAGIIVAGSNLAGGVGYRKLNVFDDIDVELEGNVSVRWYQDYRAAIGLLDSRASTLEFDVADRKVASLFNSTSRRSPGSAVYLDLRFRDYPRHTYFGTGIDSSDDNRADYALRGLSVEGVWQWQLTSALGVSARAGWLDLDVGPGRNDSLLNVEERFVPALTPGVPEQPLFFTYGAGIAHDTRLEPGAPGNGYLAGVALRRYSASNMPTLSFTRLTVDARGYRRLFSRTRRAGRPRPGLERPHRRERRHAVLPAAVTGWRRDAARLSFVSLSRSVARASEHRISVARASLRRDRAVRRHRHGRALAVAPVAGLVQDEPRSGHSRSYKPPNHRASGLGLGLRRSPYRARNRSCLLDLHARTDEWHVA
jgi:hypothetical protein